MPILLPRPLPVPAASEFPAPAGPSAARCPVGAACCRYPALLAPAVPLAPRGHCPRWPSRCFRPSHYPQRRRSRRHFLNCWSRRLLPPRPLPLPQRLFGRTMSATVAKYFYPHGDAYVSRRSKDADQREAQGQCSSVGAHQALRKSTAFGARSWTSRSSRTRRFKRPLRRLPNARWVTAPSVLRRP